MTQWRSLFFGCKAVWSNTLYSVQRRCLQKQRSFKSDPLCVPLLQIATLMPYPSTSDVQFEDALIYQMDATLREYTHNRSSPKNTESDLQGMNLQLRTGQLISSTIVAVYNALGCTDSSSREIRIRFKHAYLYERRERTNSPIILGDQA